MQAGQHVEHEGTYYRVQPNAIVAFSTWPGEWNQQMAALVGQLKDMFGGDFTAPITQYPDFEHLEKKGRKPKGN